MILSSGSWFGVISHHQFAVTGRSLVKGKVTFSLLFFLDIQPIIHKLEFLCRHIFFYSIISLRPKHSVPSSSLFRLFGNHVHPGIGRASQMNGYFALLFVFLTQYKVLNEMHLECKRQTKILVSDKKVQRRTTTENFSNSFMIMLMPHASVAMDSLDSSEAEPVSGTCNEVRLLKNLLIWKT